MHRPHVAVADQCMLSSTRQQGLPEHLELWRIEFSICLGMQHVERMQQWSEGTGSDAGPLTQMAEVTDKLARP